MFFIQVQVTLVSPDVVRIDRGEIVVPFHVFWVLLLSDTRPSQPGFHVGQGH